MNYEVLCNTFATKIIDLSKAEIYKLKNTEIKQAELEAFLEEQNQYTLQKFIERYDKMQRLKELEEQIMQKKLQVENEKKIIKERQNKLYNEIRQRKPVIEDEKKVDVNPTAAGSTPEPTTTSASTVSDSKRTVSIWE